MHFACIECHFLFWFVRGHDLAEQHSCSSEEPGCSGKHSTQALDQMMAPTSGEECHPAVAGVGKGATKKGANRSEQTVVEQKGKAKRHEKRKAGQVSGTVLGAGSTENIKKERPQDSRDVSKELKFSVPKNCSKKGRRNTIQDRNGQRTVEDRMPVGQRSMESAKGQALQGSKHSIRRGRGVQQQATPLDSSSSLQSTDAQSNCSASHTQVV